MRHTFILAIIVATAAAARADEPETVVVTYAPRPGQEAAIEKLILTHYATIARLKLVTRDAHVLYRDADKEGKPIFVDILTWKDHEAPDHAPDEVQKIWSAMQEAVEKREGRRGIEIHEVKRLR